VTGLLLFWALAAAPVDVAHRRVVSSDGVALALYRYGRVGQPPVLLIPDLGLGRAVFDTEGEGLARFLAEHGRTVYIAELRGQGAAAPGGLAARVTRDFPAVLDAIGAGKIDLVAYGWAGTLALAAADARIGRVVALSTPAEAEVPSGLLRDVLSSGGDLRALAQSEPKAFELLFSMGGRFRPGRLDALKAHAVFPLGRSAAGELLEWMRSGELRLGDGSTVRDRLRRFDRPTLLFIGLADGFANPELATSLPELTKAPVTMRTFSRAELASEDYSHLSLLQGSRARHDVFEPALRFLNEGAP
jgi:pimeloyl-ACP methyl ester carboxylesterase